MTSPPGPPEEGEPRGSPVPLATRSSGFSGPHAGFFRLVVRLVVRPVGRWGTAESNQKTADICYGGLAKHGSGTFTVKQTECPLPRRQGSC